MNGKQSESSQTQSSDEARHFGPTYFGIVPRRREIQPSQSLMLVTLGALALLVGIAGLLEMGRSRPEGD